MISAAQLTFVDQTSAAPAETASGSTPIAIVSIANGVVGSASSKDASKTSFVAATKEEEDPGQRCFRILDFWSQAEVQLLQKAC